MGKRVAIVQSSYIPWKGYFDLINAVDEFILFDDAQFTRRDWRNRNLVKTKDGLAWLSVPMKSTGKYLAPVRDMLTNGHKWRDKHWRTLAASYARAPYFKEYGPRFEALYLGSREERLSWVNRSFLEAICESLGIRTRISWSMDYELVEGQTERIVHLCRQTGTSTYISGPTARSYLGVAAFTAAGMDVVFFDYSGYPEYPQLFPPFEHRVSILDLLFNEGPHAPRRMLTFGSAP